MFRREFLAALALLPFVGRLVRANWSLFDQHNVREAKRYYEIIKRLTDRFETLLKERINFAIVKGWPNGTQSQTFYVACYMDDLQNQNVDHEYLIPMALSWSMALPPQGPYRFSPTPISRERCVPGRTDSISYITPDGIRGDLSYDGKEQKYKVTFWTGVISG